MVTLQAKLKFANKKDRQAVLNLMRQWSACKRYAYNRLLENKDRNTLKKELQKLFNLNSRYVDDAIVKAKAILKSCKELEINPKRIIFGTKKLFQKLKKKHLNGSKREELKKQWIEKRQGTLYSRGDKSRQGNLNLRIEQREEKFYLRINTGDRTYIYAEIIRKVTRNTDKWTDFIWMLHEAYKIGQFFPYTVELKLRNGEIYVLISYEENSPELKITEANGVIGIDINASPLHIAWAEVSSDGNLLSYGRISLYELLGVSKEKRDYLLWQIAHAIINLAIEKNKAILIEKLEKLPLGTKGDGMKKLRKRLHQMCYRAILERIKVLGPRKGVKVIEINPAYTSVIGALKYAPVLGIDKDIAGAYVIGRRGMKLKEKMPVNYEKLLNDIEYLSYAILRYETEIAETKEKLGKENNKWKKNAIKAHLKTLKQNLKQVKKRIERIQSTDSESGCQEQVSGWNKPVRGEVASPIPWQVVSAATVMPLLGRVFVRDYAPLKGVLVSGEWERLAEALRPGLRLRQAPVPGAGAMDTPNSACVGLEYPESGGLQIPTPELCEFAQFS